MTRKLAFPKNFRGAAEDLPTRLESNFKALLTHINSWMPSYEKREDDGSPRALILEGDLQVGGSIALPAGETVDGVDISSAVGSPPFLWAYRNANQSITNNAWTDVEWNAEWYDEGGWHNNSTNPELITVDESVLYHVIVQIKFAAHSTGLRGVRIVHDVTTIAQQLIPASGSDPCTLQTSGYVRAVAGDTISVQVFEDSGGSLDIVGSAEDDSWIQVARA